MLKTFGGVVSASPGFHGWFLDGVGMVIDVGRDVQFPLVRPPHSAGTPVIE